VPVEAALRTLGDFLEDGGDMLDSADLHGGAGDGCSFQDDGRSHGFGEDHVGGAGRRQIRDTVVVSAMECRHAREISGRFKTRAAKFAGKKDQVFSDIKTKYDLVTRDFGLSADQEMLLLHNPLDGEALRFYIEEGMRKNVSYATACVMKLPHNCEPRSRHEIATEPGHQQHCQSGRVGSGRTREGLHHDRARFQEATTGVFL